MVDFQGASLEWVFIMSLYNFRISLIYDLAIVMLILVVVHLVVGFLEGDEADFALRVRALVLFDCHREHNSESTQSNEADNSSYGGLLSHSL